MKQLVRSVAFLALVLLVATTAFAQTTGTLTGTITTAGSPLPGATVTISSPALQGTRTTVTGSNGDYNFSALPPGRYTVKAELEGMQTVTRTADLRLAETARADADLKLTTVAEAITVTATTPSVLETNQVSTSLTREQVEALPIGRTIAQRIQLAPGVNNAGPNNQTVINGAPSYDNLYLINGVVINDSIRGQPENLFIEDAIQETTLLTGGVSAEYGRFTGGVVSTITKSGGNDFSGSFRDNITNPHFTKLTNFRDPVSGAVQPANANVRNQQYEATLGGFLLRDRLWFFGAGRKFNESVSNVTTATNIPYVNQRNNKRYEAKLTGQITSKHSLVGSYLHNVTDEVNNRFGNVVDLRSLTTRQLPNWLEDFHYSGVITNNFLVEAQYSRRYFAFIGGGGPKDDLINGTLLRDNATGRRLWSPTFCACDPKTRNNKDYFAKANYFLSTQSAGSHNIVAGVDDFHELRHENNYQSGSNFRLWGDFVYVGQDVFFHADPVAGFISVNPITQLSLTNDVGTRSVFVNDKWDFTNHFTFNLGARYDKDNAKDQSKNTVARSSAFSPRLGIIYDIAGNGRDRISASYSKYVSHIDSGIADSVAVGGQPGSIYFNYRGPEINGKGTTNYIPTAQAIQMVFDWFNSVGGVSGYKDIFSISVPGLTAKLVPGGLKSPYMNEYTIGFGHQLGSSGYLRADAIARRFKNFYTSFTNTNTGQNTAANGSKVDVSLFGNTDNGVSRKYDGVQIQGAYRLLSRLNLGGNYTFSKLKGNVEGETFNNATVFAGNNDYPEYRQFAQNNPTGFLNGDIRHRANLFGNVDVPMPWGSLNLGVLHRFHTGSPYSAAGNIRVLGQVTNPNSYYAVPPTNVGYFFSGRGAFRASTINATDLTATYSLPTFGKVNVFVRGDLVNSFNRQGLEFPSTNVGAVIENRVYTRATNPRASLVRGVDTPIGVGSACAAITDPNKYGACNPFVAFNPFTTAPKEYRKGDDPKGLYNYMLEPTFGQATNKDAYQQPRTYRFAVGVRF